MSWSVIKLKSGWKVEVSEQGNVRLWLQTEALSNAAQLCLILNDREISGTPVTQPIFPSAIPVGLEKQSKRDRGGDGRGDKLIKQASNITTQLIPTSGAGDNALVHAKWTFSL